MLDAAADKAAIIASLNRILETELAGVIRYTHYSLLVFGHNRIPIVGWLREQATESLDHAHQAGEWITTLGSFPSLSVGSLLESHTSDTEEILKESLQHESLALSIYKDLLRLVEGHSVALEEYARGLILQEEMHASEVRKMLRKSSVS